MREAIGHALLFQLVLFMIFVVVLVFIETLSYSKAFKLKNRIVNIIEEHRGYTSGAQEEINSVLSDVGYQISNGISGCKTYDGAKLLYPSGYRAKGYDYCVASYTDEKGRTYYGVTTFMSFEFPIIKDLIEFPVYGETKTFGILD